MINSHIKQLQANALDRAVPETWTVLTKEQLDKFTHEFAKEIIHNIRYIISDCSVDEGNEDLYCDYVYNIILDSIDKFFGD